MNRNINFNARVPETSITFDGLKLDVEAVADCIQLYGFSIVRNLIDPEIACGFFDTGQARYNALRNHQSEYAWSGVGSPYEKFVTDSKYNTFTIPFLELNSEKYRFFERVAKTLTLQIFDAVLGHNKWIISHPHSPVLVAAPSEEMRGVGF